MRGEGRDRGQGCCKSILSAREKASQKRNPCKQIQLPTIGPCFATVLCKSKAGELLPEKTRVVKRLKEINLSLEYYLTRREINVGPQCFPSFPPPHNSLSWPKETPPTPHPHHHLPPTPPPTCPAWPTDLGTSLFSSPVILSSCERTQINL